VVGKKKNLGDPKNHTAGRTQKPTEGKLTVLYNTQKRGKGDFLDHPSRRHLTWLIKEDKGGKKEQFRKKSQVKDLTNKHFERFRGQGGEASISQNQDDLENKDRTTRLLLKGVRILMFVKKK